MHQGRMTEMEKLKIQEQLRSEELCAKKVGMYLNQVQDPAVQGLLQQMADKSQRHVSALTNLLQDAGVNSTSRH